MTRQQKARLAALHRHWAWKDAQAREAAYQPHPVLMRRLKRNDKAALLDLVLVLTLLIGASLVYLVSR